MPSTAKNPMDVFNLGCEPSAPELLSDEKLFARMNLQMSRKAAQTPVFLVNPDQMDVLSPPSRRRGLDPERVREWAESLNNADERGWDMDEDENEESEYDPLDELDEVEWDKNIVAAGLYLPQPPNPVEIMAVLHKGTPANEAAADALKSVSGPSIYLCCERIAKWANKDSVRPELAMAKVLYHELGHAIMNTWSGFFTGGGEGTYEKKWCRIIEESLANWLAVSCFKGSERVAAQRLIRRQPAEYLGYAAVDFEPLLDWRLIHILKFSIPSHYSYCRYCGHLPVVFPMAGHWNLRLWMASKSKKLLVNRHFRRPWRRLARHFLIRGSE